jgi:hypothetical protein
MSASHFTEHRASNGLAYFEAGSGEAIVAIVGTGSQPTQAHALLADGRRVIAIALPPDAGAPAEAAGQISAALETLGITRLDLLGEGAGAAAALWLALKPETEIGSVVLAAPAAARDEKFREMTRPVLILSGTNGGSNASEQLRALLPDCHFMLVYDAGSAIGDERPDALNFIAREFFERRDLFLVSREDGRLLP